MSRDASVGPTGSCQFLSVVVLTGWLAGWLAGARLLLPTQHDSGTLGVAPIRNQRAPTFLLLRGEEVQSSPSSSSHTLSTCVIKYIHNKRKTATSHGDAVCCTTTQSRLINSLSLSLVYQPAFHLPPGYFFVFDNDYHTKLIIFFLFLSLLFIFPPPLGCNDVIRPQPK